MRLIIPSGLLALSLFSGCGTKSDNDAGSTGETTPYPGVPPQSGEIQGERNFAALIKRFPQGKTKNTPWAGYWWPFLESGTADALTKMEKATNSSHSVTWELNHHSPNTPGVKSWWGHCNGWAASAVLYPEPRTSKTINNVTFSVADQKALLSEIGTEVKAEFFGTRVDNPGDSSSLAFQDVFPNQLFLALLNYVGQGFPIIMDRYTGYQVWNHPIAGYQVATVKPSDYLGASSANPDVHRVMVSAQIWWSRADVDAEHLTEPFSFQDGPSFQSRTLRFEVWLDAPPRFDSQGKLESSGNVLLERQGSTVLAGAWRNGNLESANSHPDYLWIVQAITPATRYTNPYVDFSWVTKLVNQGN